MATTRPLSEILPKEMTELRVRPIFTLLLEVQPAINVGKTPGVDRRVGVITGGRFEGERLRGTLFSGGGSDWQSVRPGDGAWMINVRIVLKTDDDAIIGTASLAARWSRRPTIICALPRRSKPRRRNTAGSTTSSASASATDCRRGRSIRCSRCSRNAEFYGLVTERIAVVGRFLAERFKATSCLRMVNTSGE